jgi:hypothetical protein
VGLLSCLEAGNGASEGPRESRKHILPSTQITDVDVLSPFIGRMEPTEARCLQAEQGKTGLLIQGGTPPSTAG